MSLQLYYEFCETESQSRGHSRSTSSPVNSSSTKIPSHIKFATLPHKDESLPNSKSFKRARNNSSHSTASHRDADTTLSLGSQTGGSLPKLSQYSLPKDDSSPPLSCSVTSSYQSLPGPSKDFSLSSLPTDNSLLKRDGPARIANWQRRLGEAYVDIGNLERARRHFDRALDLYRENLPQYTTGLFSVSLSVEPLLKPELVDPMQAKNRFIYIFFDFLIAFDSICVFSSSSLFPFTYLFIFFFK